MQFITQKELNDKKELEAYIASHHLDLPDYRCAVIALITDKEGKILLQRRGPKSRDENFKLEDIGGGVEEEDVSFTQAVQREIREEVGDKAQFSIDSFLGCFLNSKYDKRVQQTIHWLFFVYKVTYEGGDLLIQEPGKCLGYEFYFYEDLPKEEVTESSFYYWNYYHASQTCYSYAMEIGERISHLDSCFSVQEDDGDYEVTFSKEYASLWEEFVASFLEKGYWNEYILGNQIVFLFKSEQGDFERIVLTEETNSIVLAKCSFFANEHYSSVREMVSSNSFYHDKLEFVTFYD